MSISSVANNVSQPTYNAAKSTDSQNAAPVNSAPASEATEAPAHESAGSDEVELSSQASSLAEEDAAVSGKESESEENADLAQLKQQMAEELGINEDSILVISCSGKDDKIDVTSKPNDSVVVSINGREYTYTAEEASRLIIDGGEGNDEITIDKGVTQNMYVLGGDGDDTIKGGSGNDRLYGGAGDDYIRGGDGDDRIFGGEGNDKLKGSSGKDYIEGGAGNDNMNGGSGYDVLYGLSGDDTLEGGAGNDYLDGGTGNDALKGGFGNDNLVGGQGDDDLQGGFGDDLLVGCRGNDTMSGGLGQDKVISSGSGDTINGDAKDAEVEVRNPVDVPSNFIIDGTPEEIERIESDFEFLANTANGEMMFDEIAATGHNVVVRTTSGGSYMTSYVAGSETPGVGSDSTIYYNTSKVSLGSGYAWADRAPVVSMYHEMCHCYNAATGTMDRNYYDYDGNLSDSLEGTKGVEFQAVGIENPSVNNNDELLTENGLRELLGFEQRLKY